jgi:hypothetical protein
MSEQNADYVAVRDALQACWDEYHELMPDALYEQVKAALAIRVFTAELGTDYRSSGNNQFDREMG